LPGAAAAARFDSGSRLKMFSSFSSFQKRASASRSPLTKAACRRQRCGARAARRGRSRVAPEAAPQAVCGRAVAGCAAKHDAVRLPGLLGGRLQQVRGRRRAAAWRAARGADAAARARSCAWSEKPCLDPLSPSEQCLFFTVRCVALVTRALLTRRLHSAPLAPSRARRQVLCASAARATRRS
jgi:hypothetical protein